MLLLTHFSPALDKPDDYIENAKNVSYKTELAYDGLKCSLNFGD